MSSRTTEKILTIYKPEEILVPLGRDLVSWLCDILKRYLH